MHSIHKIIHFKVQRPYVIEVIFEDEVVKVVDLGLVLKGEMHGPLNDPEIFSRAALDKETNTIFWPNGADFDPSLLYDWDLHKEELQERARQWPAH